MAVLEHFGKKHSQKPLGVKGTLLANYGYSSSYGCGYLKAVDFHASGNE